MTSASTSGDPSDIICHVWGKAGYFRGGCDVPAKTHGGSNKPAGHKNTFGPRGSAERKRCSVHKKTTHNDAECNAQGAPRP